MLSKKILSAQHDIVKFAVKLRENGKFRREHSLAVVNSLKIIEELSQKTELDTLFYAAGKTPPNLSPKNCIEVSQAVLKKITGLASPDGYAAFMKIPAEKPFKGDLLIALDAVQQPDNIGAIFRSALGLGASGILLLPGSGDPFHEKAIQSGRGAQFTLPYRSLTQEQLLLLKSEYTLYGTLLCGTPLPTLTPKKPLILIMGNEGHGISPSLASELLPITIPTKNIESLNVAVAAGICLYHLSGKIAHD